MPRSLASQILLAALAILNLAGGAEDVVQRICSAEDPGLVELRDLHYDGVLARFCGFESGETVHCYLQADGSVHEYRAIPWPQEPDDLVLFVRSWFSKFSLKGERDQRLTLSILAVGDRSGRNVSLAVTIDASVAPYSFHAAALVRCVSCRFTTHWAADNAPQWAALFRPWSREEEGREIDVLEVGSWEGLSALWFAQNLRVRGVACVDSWEGGAEHKADTTFFPELSGLEARFDHNIAAAPLPASVTITKLRGLSHQRLAGLVGEDPPRAFDLIYVDGEHSARGVLSDLVLALHLLAPGGLVVVDDIFWPGVEEVIATVASAHSDLTRTRAGCPSGQACFRKRGA
ncbi:methyltransferase domain-containing protein [Baffinella frigidus]|nr:methyltransferase domain-containing protein [Cryptophyta sp. CCMP2293]